MSEGVAERYAAAIKALTQRVRDAAWWQEAYDHLANTHHELCLCHDAYRDAARSGDMEAVKAVLDRCESMGWGDTSGP